MRMVSAVPVEKIHVSNFESARAVWKETTVYARNEVLDVKSVVCPET